MKPRVLIGHNLSTQRLKSLGTELSIECIGDNAKKYDEVLSRIGECDALYAISHPVDRVMLDKASSLKIIANFGVGYDNIDVDYAKEKGIVVTNTPQSTSEPTATLAMALILSAMRKVVQHDHSIRSNQLGDWSHHGLLGTAPEGKVLGILGMGRIGKCLARRALAFNMKVIYYNRNKLRQGEGHGDRVDYVSFEDLCRLSDVISIHLPLNKTTRNIVSHRELAWMKETSWLINTSRGGVVDMAALIDVLDQGRIAGAGLDVFPEEPVIPEALLSMKNVVLTPHIGTGTREDREAMFWEAFGYIRSYFKGEKIDGRVV